MGRLDGKVAFITGVARGQGRSHAVRLASEGADIIGVDICADIPANGYAMATREELAETEGLVAAQGRRMFGVVADVRDFLTLQTALDAAVAELGRLDIVCANAGIAPMSFAQIPIEEELAQWDAVVGVNLTGAFHAMRAALPHLIEGGRGGSMIITSSTAGLVGLGGPQGGGLGYAASKHGLVGMMRCLANSLAKYEIRVNTVHPTAVRTMMAVNPGMTAWLENNPDATGPHLQNPMPVEMLEPADISNTIAFLCSDEAKYITGVAMPVDAGFCNKL
ncbi:mycofactocin-coupled SDR family oxidoreductase [Spirillospora sp. NPDC000708]